MAGDSTRSHGEAHVLGPVDELQDGAGGLVGGFALLFGVLVTAAHGVIFEFLFGFDAEHAGVAARSVGVAFAEGAEELGDDFVWFLFVISGGFVSDFEELGGQGGRK